MLHDRWIDEYKNVFRDCSKYDVVIIILFLPKPMHQTSYILDGKQATKYSLLSLATFGTKLRSMSPQWGENIWIFTKRFYMFYFILYLSLDFDFSFLFSVSFLICVFLSFFDIFILFINWNSIRFFKIVHSLNFLIFSFSLIYFLLNLFLHLYLAFIYLRFSNLISYLYPALSLSIPTLFLFFFIQFPLFL